MFTEIYETLGAILSINIFFHLTFLACDITLLFQINYFELWVKPMILRYKFATCALKKAELVQCSYINLPCQVKMLVVLKYNIVIMRYKNM